MSVTTLSQDFETASECDLKKAGLYNYATDMTTRALMLSYKWNNGPVEFLDFTKGDRVPSEIEDAWLDPHVEKWAFNAAFERMTIKHVLGIDTPIKGWRCTMALAYMRSFNGSLESVGVQLGLPLSKLKDPEGTRLVRVFTMPQKITKNQPHRWRDRHTDPEDWEKFCAYCIRDTESEDEVKQRLLGMPTLHSEWELYELDQIINDRGMPVDMQFVRQAAIMSNARKHELKGVMANMTELDNPNSVQQLVPWLQDGGYPFGDVNKLTVKKVLAENELEEDEFKRLPDNVVDVLKLRQQASRSSVSKYTAITNRVAWDDKLRHGFQFAGASRTNRWSGRGAQPHNLVRTPKEFSELVKLIAIVEAIRQGDYDLLSILVAEPMDALAGCIRSVFRAPPGWEFVVCDLSAIESAVIAWLSGCARLLDVFKNGLDPYKDFGVELYKKLYEEVTSEERGICKPAVLGCGFGLGGGDLKLGKRTGLWAYAEGMGVNLAREEAHRQVDLFRKVYHEIPTMWKDMDKATKMACRGETVDYNGKLQFRTRGDYLTMQLPSGRLMYYHKPKMRDVAFPGRPIKEQYRIEQPNGSFITTTRELPGEPYIVKKFTCMGMSQITKQWGRITSGGPKTTENAVQATAREVLVNGMRRAHRAGFYIVGHVHDELITLRRKGSNRHGLDELRECMTHKEFWMEGLPLKAAGYVSELYRKD